MPDDDDFDFLATAVGDAAFCSFCLEAAAAGGSLRLGGAALRLGGAALRSCCLATAVGGAALACCTVPAVVGGGALRSCLYWRQQL